MRFLGSVNLAFVVVLTAIAGYVNWTKRETDTRWSLLWRLLALSTPYLMIVNLIVCSLQQLLPAKEDLYFFCADRFLGDPSFHIGRFLNQHSWIGNTCLAGYLLLPIPVCSLAVLYALTQPPESTKLYVRTLLLNFSLCIPLYLAVPVAGPYYAFPGFPWTIPSVTSPHTIAFGAIPNGFPSVHTSTAFLLFYFARQWRIGKVLSVIYVGIIILATLGTGEHYAVDLIAGSLYAAVVIWIGSEQKSEAHQNIALAGQMAFGQD